MGYMMGCIRIRCHQNIVIEEDCQISVNGKGYYGDNGGSNPFCVNPGRGQKKTSNAIEYYAGGGYGSNGSDCVDANKKTICHGGSAYGDERLSVLYFGSSGGK